MTNHTPKQPSDLFLSYIETHWQIIPSEGIVLGVSGKPIGYQDEEGYIYCAINKKPKGIKAIRRSHLVWWKHYGVWPTQQLDHEDRNQQNDRINNLRLSTSRQNNLNRKPFVKRQPRPWSEF